MLTFVHIPKNAGTTIEGVAYGQQKLRWGKRADTDGNETRKEHLHDTALETPTRKGAHTVPVHACQRDARNYFSEGPPSCCVWWHTPPRRLCAPPGASHYDASPLRFCVVRDPIDRLLSNYLMSHREFRSMALPTLCSKLLERARSSGPGSAFHFDAFVRHSVLREASRAPQTSDCHYLGQDQFVAARHVEVSALQDRPVAEVLRRLHDPSDRRSCNVVVRYERLVDDFNTLMHWANVGLSLRPLPSSKRLGNESSGTKHLMCGFPARELLNGSTAAQIDHFYREDNRMFGWTSASTRPKFTPWDWDHGLALPGLV
jgi:hypothetical protein